MPLVQKEYMQYYIPLTMTTVDGHWCLVVVSCSNLLFSKFAILCLRRRYRGEHEATGISNCQANLQRSAGDFLSLSFYVLLKRFLDATPRCCSNGITLMFSYCGDFIHCLHMKRHHMGKIVVVRRLLHN